MFRAITLAAVLVGAPMQTIAAPVGETALIEQYFQTLKEGDAQKATAALFSNTPVMQKNEGGLDALAGTTATYMKYYGPVLSWAKVKENTYAPGVKRQYWLLRTANGPLFVKFDMYEGPNGWSVIKVMIIEDYDTAFEMAK